VESSCQRNKSSDLNDLAKKLELMGRVLLLLQHPPIPAKGYKTGICSQGQDKHQTIPSSLPQEFPQCISISALSSRYQFCHQDCVKIQPAMIIGVVHGGHYFMYVGPLGTFFKNGMKCSICVNTLTKIYVSV